MMLISSMTCLLDEKLLSEKANDQATLTNFFATCPKNRNTENLCFPPPLTPPPTLHGHNRTKISRMTRTKKTRTAPVVKAITTEDVGKTRAQPKVTSLSPIFSTAHTSTSFSVTACANSFKENRDHVLKMLETENKHYIPIVFVWNEIDMFVN
jgi:hypothetical protein